MLPWQLIDRVPTPDQRGELRLYRRGDEFSIQVDRVELMNSRQHGSEAELARLAFECVPDRRSARVLVGGLGMGFTLAAANALLPATAFVEVAELVEAVVQWNRGPLGECAGRPLDDPRVRVVLGDVREVIAGASGRYDAILLDVDNGPEGLTQASNARLYRPEGLDEIRRALSADGVLAVWSAGPDSRFTRQLAGAGFAVSAHQVRARASGKGARHTIWIARPVGG